VYAFVHVMCLCVYVSMVCQRCMLYDDMYSHDIVHKLSFLYFQTLGDFDPGQFVCLEHQQLFCK
jgi:hypothetical protein